MTLYIENLIYLDDNVNIILSFENIDSELENENFNNAKEIVSKLKEMFPDKIEYIYNLITFSMKLDMEFIMWFLAYLMITKNVKLDIDGTIIKLNEYDTYKLNDIREYLVEFCKKECLRIQLVKKRNDAILKQIENKYLEFNLGSKSF